MHKSLTKAEGEQSQIKYEKPEYTETLFIAFQKYSSLLNRTTLVPFRPELDACDSPDKYPQLFHVILDIEIQSADRQTELTPPWENFTTKDINPSILFSSHQEHQDTLALAGKGCMDLFPVHDFFMLSWVSLDPHLWCSVLQVEVPQIPPRITSGTLGRVHSSPLSAGKVGKACSSESNLPQRT